MEQKRLTLVREKGKEIPTLVLESALLNFGASISVAYAHAEGGVPVVEVFQLSLKDVEHTGGALGQVKDILDETKDHKVILHFSAEELDPQPFVILTNEKKNPTLVAFLIGDFSEHTKTNGHSTEYVEATEYLTPKLLELYERADDDIPKLMAKLKEPNITRELNKMGSGEFLNCTLLASNGDMLGYCRPKSPPVKYDWGSASGDMDEHKAEPKKEPEKKPEPAAAPKSLTLAERLAAKKAQQAGGTPPAEEKPKEGGTKELSPGQHQIQEPAKGKPMESLADRMKAKKAAKEEGSGEEQKPALHVVGIPVTFDKQKNRRKWFAQRGPTGEVGIDFPDWMTRKNPILVPLHKLQQLHSKQTVEELTKRFPLATAEEIAKYAGSQVPLKQEPAPQVAKSTVEPTKDMPGVISAAHKQQLRERFLSKPKIIALVDKKGQSLMDPAFLPAMEDKNPQFWEDLGLPNLEATDWWKVEDYLDGGSYSLNWLAKAAFNEKMARIKKDKRIMELEAQVAQLKGEPLPGSSAGVGGNETKTGLTLAERLAAKKKAAA